MSEPEVTGRGAEDESMDMSHEEIAMPAPSPLKGMGPRRPSTGSTLLSARVTANQMIEAKNARKRAEADVHLLANRLAHLQAEEEKARRKTEETRQRALEIKRLKQQNQELARERENNARMQGKNASDHERAVAERKVKQQNDLQSTKANLQKQRKTNAKSAREQRQALQMTYQEIRAQKAAENRRQTEMIKNQRMEARLKKEAEQREREARQQEEQRRRIANEQKKARKPLNDMPPIREVHHHEPAVQRCKKARRGKYDREDGKGRRRADRAAQADTGRSAPCLSAAPRVAGKLNCSRAFFSAFSYYQVPLY